MSQEEINKMKNDIESLRKSIGLISQEMMGFTISWEYTMQKISKKLDLEFDPDDYQNFALKRLEEIQEDAMKVLNESEDGIDLGEAMGVQFNE